MTIRSGFQALQNQKKRRAQTLCGTFAITRTDGQVVRFTDHDRPLTIDGEVYHPIGLGTISAERREAGLRADSQEASGPIDGVLITIEDLEAKRYTGASLLQRTVDWRRPWVWHYQASKTVRNMSRDGSSWVATLEGFGARLQRAAGGRFGGMHQTQCNYRWGDPATCRADRMIGLQYGPSLAFTTTAASTTSLTQGTATWTVDQWVDWSVVVSSGSARGEEARILSNTATALTLRTALPTNPGVGASFVIGRGVNVDSVSDSRMVFTLDAADYDEASFGDDYFRHGEAHWYVGDNAYTKSPIVGYVQSTRTVTLLFPTRFDIQVGDRAIIRAGCDGLRGTCDTKFSNVDNFGGTDVYSPGAAAALEQPT